MFIIENQNLDQAGCMHTRGNNPHLLPFTQIAMSAENKVYSWMYCNHTSIKS